MLEFVYRWELSHIRKVEKQIAMLLLVVVFFALVRHSDASMFIHFWLKKKKFGEFADSKAWRRAFRISACDAVWVENPREKNSIIFSITECTILKFVFDDWFHLCFMVSFPICCSIIVLFFPVRA